mmetsp:Transcript_63987/g.181726  ORF Transcript_63987/g.181726 Transcript_63987/m.181726 type:complete len:292 (-) Transcript_63987:1337-2212(-)
MVKTCDCSRAFAIWRLEAITHRSDLVGTLRLQAFKRAVHGRSTLEDQPALSGTRHPRPVDSRFHDLPGPGKPQVPRQPTHAHFVRYTGEHDSAAICSCEGEGHLFQVRQNCGRKRRGLRSAGHVLATLHQQSALIQLQIDSASRPAFGQCDRSTDQRQSILKAGHRPASHRKVATEAFSCRAYLLRVAASTICHEQSTELIIGGCSCIVPDHPCLLSALGSCNQGCRVRDSHVSTGPQQQQGCSDAASLCCVPEWCPLSGITEVDISTVLHEGLQQGGLGARCLCTQNGNM